MAKKRTRRTTVYTYTVPYWMLEFSFWLIVIIGGIMAIFGILNAAGVEWNWLTSALSYIKSICMTLALIIPAFLSYRIARHKGTTWFVLWLVFVILVLVGVITSIL